MINPGAADRRNDEDWLAPVLVLTAATVGAFCWEGWNPWFGFIIGYLGSFALIGLLLFLAAKEAAR